MNTVFIKAPKQLEAKAVLASIQPKWNSKIFTFEKEVEIRKNRPKLATPFRVLVYSTKPKRRELGICIAPWAGEKRLGGVFPINYRTAECMGMTLLDGKIIGEFICDRITEFQVFEDGSVQNWNFAELDKSCVPYEDVAAYVGAGRKGYAWHISEPVLYEAPIDISAAADMFGLNAPLASPPQSWVYVRPIEAQTKGGVA